MNKGKLDKSSTPNWSSSIYSVSKVIPRRKRWRRSILSRGRTVTSSLVISRNDLQIVEGEPNEVPKRISHNYSRKMGG